MDLIVECAKCGVEFGTAFFNPKTACTDCELYERGMAPADPRVVAAKVQFQAKPEPRQPGAPCHGCAGTGTYRGKGGATGVCYRCQGKGYQSGSDRKRNFAYDNFYRAGRN